MKSGQKSGIRYVRDVSTLTAAERQSDRRHARDSNRCPREDFVSSPSPVPLPFHPLPSRSLLSSSEHLLARPSII